MSLLVAPCNHKAARYAVEHWHYSQTMPVGKLVKYGVWEDEVFIGATLFSWGANRNLGSLYKLEMTECAELVRVALTDHACFASSVVAKSLRLLKQNNPGLRLVVSFADPWHNHHGGIYQAGNWIYTGTTACKSEWILPNGKVLNRRAYTGQQFGGGKGSVATVPDNAMKVKMPAKHRYVYPLDRAMRRQVEPLRLPYPPAVEVSEEKHGASSAEG